MTVSEGRAADGALRILLAEVGAAIGPGTDRAGATLNRTEVSMRDASVIGMSLPCDAGAEAIPQHVAIIMDGNGRWAVQRGLPRLAGHRAGVSNVRRILRAAVQHGVRYLTLYAFSTENWSRPRDEVSGLLGLLSEFIDRETRALHEAGVQIRHLGTLDELPQMLQEKICQAIELTSHNSTLTVAVAFNYGGRAEILHAVRTLIAEGARPEGIDEGRIAGNLWTAGLPDPDLVIRTSGETRLSNFLIWQTAYSEFWSTRVLWPDFGPEEFGRALDDYAGRQRRFGGLGPAAAVAAEQEIGGVVSWQ